MPEPTTPMPRMPSFPRFFWQVLTFKLLRRDRPAFWRVWTYGAIIYAMSIAMLTASDGKNCPDAHHIFIATMTAFGQVACSACLFDMALRRDARSEWFRKEVEANADAYAKKARESVDEFRRETIEYVNAHAMKVKRQLDKHARDVDGESWKGGDTPKLDDDSSTNTH